MNPEMVEVRNGLEIAAPKCASESHVFLSGALSRTAHTPPTPHPAGANDPCRDAVPGPGWGWGGSPRASPPRPVPEVGVTSGITAPPCARGVLFTVKPVVVPCAFIRYQ